MKIPKLPDGTHIPHIYADATLINPFPNNIFGTNKSLVLVVWNILAGAETDSLFVDGDNTPIVLLDNSAWVLQGVIQATSIETNPQTYAWKIRGVIRRQNGAANTAIYGATVTAIGGDLGPPTTPTLTADTINGGLTITVTGVAGKDVSFLGKIDIVEISGVRKRCGPLMVSDLFTDSDGVSLEAHSANWTQVSGLFEIFSNGLAVNYNGFFAAAFWNANNFYKNHYAQAILDTFVLTTTRIGVCVRCTAGISAPNCYAVVVYTTVLGNPGNPYLYKVIGELDIAQFIVLDEAFTSFASGDTLYLEAIDNIIKVKKNGVVVSTVLDNDIKSGQPGVAGWNHNSNNHRLASFEAANIC